MSKQIRPQPGARVLDVGCGPADILGYLPEIEYCGFDVSAPYVEQARSKYGTRGHFFRKELNETDLVVAVLHHLDDQAANSLLKLAHLAPKPGGRLVTLDPCFHPRQHPIARLLIAADRGHNVRTLIEYERLAREVFPESSATLRHKSGVPYTHCIMECLRS